MITGGPEIYSRDDWLAIDLETVGHFREPDATLECVCWIDSKGRGGVYVGGELLPHELVDKISSASFLVAHSSGYEAGWLQRCGFDPRKLNWWCTLNAEWLLMAGLPTGDRLGLDASCARRGIGGKRAFGARLLKRGIPVSEWPRSVMVDYCLRDAWCCAELFKVQRDLLSRAYA